MIDRNGNFPNLDGIENGGPGAECLVVDLDPLSGQTSNVKRNYHK